MTDNDELVRSLKDDAILKEAIQLLEIDNVASERSIVVWRNLIEIGERRLLEAERLGPVGKADPNEEF